MIEFFEILKATDNFLWSYIDFSLICLAGIYLTFKSNFLQFRVLKNFRKNFNDLLKESKKNTSEIGVSPFKLYFASVGGMVGMGNIVSISGAIMIGGPGSIFWMWVASLFGMLLKYSEIYLGVKYRVLNTKGSYDGGPMYFLPHAFNSKFLANFSAFLLCIYGIEIYQFGVLTKFIESTFEVNKYLIIALMLILAFYTVVGGIKRLSDFSSILMPGFLLSYIFICLYIIVLYYSLLPSLLISVLKSAFTGHAAVGGFAGSSMLLAAYMGTSKAVYSGDIGIGYDSVVQSETRLAVPKKQAQIAIYALFTDTFICTLTTLVILVTGAWQNLNHLQSSDVISTIFSEHFPNIKYFMVALLFISGFTTIIAFFTAGLKSANFLNAKYGKYCYFIYALIAFVYFSELNEETSQLIMTIPGGILMLINVTGIIKLRNKIEF